MIHLVMNTHSNNTQVPIELRINNDIFIYDTNKIFIQLQEYINYKIKISYVGFKIKETNSIIEDVYKNSKDSWCLNIKDIM